MIKPQYLTFLDVCEYGSFSKAAEKRFITPSAVIQQIKSLESELQTKLFFRTSKGVTLTPEGSYLCDSMRDLIDRSKKILSEMDRMKNHKVTISVAFSMIEKCRLLYDLWVLFSNNHTAGDDYEIRMNTISQQGVIPEHTDLLESINSGNGWMNEWNFLKITDVPFVLATGALNPLHHKSALSLKDLKGVDVLTLNNGTAEAVVNILSAMRTAGANIKYYSGSLTKSILESAFSRNILLIPACWSDILVNMKVHPLTDVNEMLPYGIFYSKNASAGALEFLEFIRNLYENGDEDAVVPFF